MATATKKEQITASDRELVERTLAGEQEAFELLVQRYSPLLAKMIYTILGDYHQVHDILQVVFVQLYRSLPTLETERPLKAWLFRVARNRCFDELRRERPVLFCDLESSSEEEESLPFVAIPDTSPQPDELAERSDVQQRLRRAIDHLPARFRSVVLLRYAGQLSYAEIGRQLHIPEATAKTYFQRAKPLLRAALLDEHLQGTTAALN